MVVDMDIVWGCVVVFIVGLISVLLSSELFLMCSDTSRDVGDVLFLFASLAVGMVIIFVFSY